VTVNLTCGGSCSICLTSILSMCCLQALAQAMDTQLEEASMIALSHLNSVSRHTQAVCGASCLSSTLLGYVGPPNPNWLVTLFNRVLCFDLGGKSCNPLLPCCCC
jgi:hypothetical protein